MPEVAARPITDEEIRDVRVIVAPNAPDTQIKLLITRCRELGCDPKDRMIYLVSRKEKKGTEWVERWTLQTSIDFMRSCAEVSDKYAGQRGPFWCGKDGEWKDVWIPDESPIAAKVGILRHDFVEPLWSVARFSDYVQTDRDGVPTQFWRRMGPHMIAKCAESLGLHRAFPKKFTGIYVAEEMGNDAPTAPQAAEPAQTPAQAEAPASPPPQPKSADPAKPGDWYANLPRELQDAARKLGVFPRAIQADLAKHQGDVGALIAEYQARLAAQTPRGDRGSQQIPAAAEPQSAPTAVASQEPIDDFEPEPEPARPARPAQGIDKVRETVQQIQQAPPPQTPREKAETQRLVVMFQRLCPQRDERIAFASRVLGRPIESFKDVSSAEEREQLALALEKELASKGARVNTQPRTCPSCGAHPGSPHDATCDLAA